MRLKETGCCQTEQDRNRRHENVGPTEPESHHGPTAPLQDATLHVDGSSPSLQVPVERSRNVCDELGYMRQIVDKDNDRQTVLAQTLLPYTVL